MPIKPSTPTSLMQTLITKVKQFRQVFAQCGYSQYEFQQYFLTHVLHYQLKSTQNATKCLTQQLMAVNTSHQIEGLLGIIDQQINSLSKIYDDKENNRVTNESQPNKNDNNQEKIRKRKSSKQQKQLKKQKRIKGQKNKKQKDDPSKLAQKQIIQNRECEIFQNLFKKQTQQTNIFSRFFKQPLSQYPVDSYENREARQKELIYQKLIQIQMLSKLMCPDSQNIMFGQRKVNPFYRIC